MSFGNLVYPDDNLTPVTFNNYLELNDDCDPIINNIVGDRPNQRLQDVDYQVNKLNPINFDQIIRDEAVRATVPESNYTQIGFANQRYFGMVDALKKGEKVKGATADMRKTAKDMSNKDVKDFAKTKHKGLPNRVSEAVNVQSIKDEVMGAVRSGNPREMKRVSDTIAKRIRDLMDLRGTAGKEVDAEIITALPVLKKAQMMLRDKQKMSEEKTRIDKKCWKGKKIGNPKTKVKGGVRVNNCVPKE